jgi:hypothetical protein
LAANIISETILKPACALARDTGSCKFDDLLTKANDWIGNTDDMPDITKDNHLYADTLDAVKESLSCFETTLLIDKSDTTKTFLPTISKGFIKSLATLNSVLILIALILMTIVTGKFILVGASSATMFSGGISVLARPAKYGLFIGILYPFSALGGLSILQAIFIMFAIVGSAIATGLLFIMESNDLKPADNPAPIADVIKKANNDLKNKHDRGLKDAKANLENVLVEVQSRLSVSNLKLSPNIIATPIQPVGTYNETKITSAVTNCLYSGNYPDKLQSVRKPGIGHANNDNTEKALETRVKTILSFISPPDHNVDIQEPLPFECYQSPRQGESADNLEYKSFTGTSRFARRSHSTVIESEIVFSDLLEKVWEDPNGWFLPEFYKNKLLEGLNGIKSCNAFKINKNNATIDERSEEFYHQATVCIKDAFDRASHIQNDFYHTNYKVALVYSNPKTSKIYKYARKKNATFCKDSVDELVNSGSITDKEQLIKNWNTTIESFTSGTPFDLWGQKESSKPMRELLPIQNCLTINNPLEKNHGIKLSIEHSAGKFKVIKSLNGDNKFVQKYEKAYLDDKTSALVTLFLEKNGILNATYASNPNKCSGVSCASLKYGWAGAGVVILKYLSTTVYPESTPTKPPPSSISPSASDDSFNDKSSGWGDLGANNVGEFIGEMMFDNIIQHIVNKMIKTDLDNIRGDENKYWGDEPFKQDVANEWGSPMIVMKKKLNYCFDNPAGCLVLSDHPIADMVELGKLAISTYIYFEIFDWVFVQIELYIFPTLAKAVIPLIIIFFIEWVAQYILFITAIASPLLLMGGLTLVFIIPLTPLFYIAQAVIQYLILLFEGLVALPVWGMLMVREERSHQDSQIGYSMFGQMLLYPPLIVISVYIGVIVSKYGLVLLNIMAYPLLVISDLDTAGFLLGPILSVIIYISSYTILAFFIVKFAFSFVNKFPNEVFTWLGISSVEEIDEGGIAQVAVVGVAQQAIGRITNASKDAASGGIRAASKAKRESDASKEKSTYDTKP